MQTEAFEPAGSSGSACTVTVAGSVASASGTLLDVVARGSPGAANKVQIFNASGGTAFCRFTVGASTAVNTDYPVAPGAMVVIKIKPTADTASVILSAGTGNVYFTLGDGI